jgi:hypothetical protein
VECTDAEGKGDPWLFASGSLEIDFADNSAREHWLAPGGAPARGIKVPRARLLELLAGRTRVDKVLQPKAWLARALNYPKEPNERTTAAYIRRLHGLMQRADNVTKVWDYPTFRNRYYEAVKAAQPQASEKSGSPKLVLHSVKRQT